MALTQQNRPAGIETPLGEDVLVLKSFSGTEQLGRLFEFNLELLSENHNIKFADLIGQNVTVWLKLKNGGVRHFNGCVSRFIQTVTDGRHANYMATVVPWFWFLTRTCDCRIFQETTVPNIIQTVFRDFSFGNEFRNNLTHSYRQWEFCVHYRETAFNFISRLMEQEGIHYFFEHEKDKHTMVLADASDAHQAYPDYDTLCFRPFTGRTSDREFIFEWTVEQNVQPGAYELTDFDFKAPQKDLKAGSQTEWSHAHSKYEVFDYPGEYYEPSEGKDFARLRLDELKAQHETISGVSNAGGIAPGCTFDLSDHPRDDQNRKYLVTSASYSIRCDYYESNRDAASDSFSCRFTAIDATVPFVTPRRSPRPIVQGPQTAIVVGPAGEEIYTDSDARVKVQFHWDRYGKRDENSSCWIRVSQANAGKGWGSMITPRIGQEVIVEFLEGDPDRPIITGRVYNGEQAPPYAGGNGVVSGIKSNTHKGSGNNEMSLDDTAGKENFKMNAQFDMNTTVGNDQNNSVTNNRTTSIGVDDSETVGSNQTVKIGANQSISVGACETETVAIAKALSIGAGYQVSVGAGMNESIGAVKGEQIGGAKIVAVGGVSKEMVGASKSVTAGSSISEKAGSKMSLVAGAGITAAAGGKMALSCRGNFSANGKAKGIVEMASQLVLKCGGASITLKSGGDILIKGTKIKIQGSKVDVKASGDVKIKGSKIGEN